MSVAPWGTWKREKRGLLPALNTDPDGFYPLGSLSYLGKEGGLINRRKEVRDAVIGTRWRNMMFGGFRMRFPVALEYQKIPGLFQADLSLIALITSLSLFRCNPLTINLHPMALHYVWIIILLSFT